MSMVDSRFRFIWGSCGFPGNSHDASIFQDTDLWQNINEHGFILGKWVGNGIVPPLIVADSAFHYNHGC